MLRRRVFWIGLAIIVLALAAGGGTLYYTRVYLPGQKKAEQPIATAQVRQGDLVISVSGSGTLVPASEMDLGFQSKGYLDEVLVEVGDQVREGDVLARLKTDELKLAVDEADIEARLAQLELDDAREGPTNTELASARASVQSARSALLVVQNTYSTTLNSDFDSAVRARLIEYQYFVNQAAEADRKREEGTITAKDYQEVYDNRAKAEARLNEALREAQMEQLEAENQVDQAQNRIYQAGESLQLVQSGPTTDTVRRAELAAEQATRALEDARDALESSVLYAPFDGTIVDVTAIPGQYVTSSFITLADLEGSLIEFWVEESDLSGVAVGNRVEVTFEALPDDVFTGEVIRIDPALVTVDMTLAVQAWARLALSSTHSSPSSANPVTLLGGMNAEVEIISAESRDTLIVPIQALRELGTEQYAVMVVQPDGEMVLRPVEVGLKDLANAEILSGLEAGETVSLGVQASTEVSTEQPFGGPMGMPGGIFMGEPGGH